MPFLFSYNHHIVKGTVYVLGLAVELPAPAWSLAVAAETASTEDDGPHASSKTRKGEPPRKTGVRRPARVGH
jgi:hypothetical protein